ncbi:hypothetical protein BDV12DRAFT_178419 [Aspergillus spectabilis]
MPIPLPIYSSSRRILLRLIYVVLPPLLFRLFAVQKRVRCLIESTLSLAAGRPIRLRIYLRVPLYILSTCLSRRWSSWTATSPGVPSPSHRGSSL